MSTCPTNEIHSLYLDNELPQTHREQYEAHIAECEVCKAQLEKLRELRSLFVKDANEISPDKDFMDKSYERLMLKMKYSKHAGHSVKNSGRSWKIIVPAAAAVAVLALAIPLKLAVGRANVKTMSATSSLYSRVPSQVSENLSSVSFNGENAFGFDDSIQNILPSSKTESQDALVTNVSGAASKLIQDVEVFRPNFDGEQKTISIKITIPGNDDVPVTTEIEVPLDAAGQN
ncbi:MAG: zf-HC2 domain-containing protein [Succinivibrio sp.]|nr:zf-HC2 domain-containing protein [Succinivibrio sp.]